MTFCITLETPFPSLSTAYTRRFMEKMQMEVTGRDLLTGLPKRVTISSDAVRDAFKDLLGTLVDAVKATLETTPPELIADIMRIFLRFNVFEF